MQKGRLCQVDNYKYSHLSLGSTAKRSFTCFVRLNRWKDDNSQLVSPQFGNWCFIQPGQLGIPVDIIVPPEMLRAHHGVLGILPLRSLQLYKIDPLLPSIQRLGPRIPKIRDCVDVNSIRRIACVAAVRDNTSIRHSFYILLRSYAMLSLSVKMASPADVTDPTWTHSPGSTAVTQSGGNFRKFENS